MTQVWQQGLRLFAPLCVIWLGAVFLARAPMERDLEARANIMLRQTGLDWAMPRLAGRNVHLTGTAPHAPARREAINLVYGVWGVRHVSDAIKVVNVLQPHTLRLERVDDRLVVTGFVATRDDRIDMIADIKKAQPKLTVIDRLKLGRSQPAGWMAASRFAARLAGLLASGRIDIAGRQFSIIGRPLDAKASKALTRALAQQLPRDYTLQSQNLGPAP